MAIWGLSDAGNDAPPGPENRIVAVAAPAAVSSRKNVMVPGDITCMEVSAETGIRKMGWVGKPPNGPPLVTDHLAHSCSTFRETNRFAAGAAVRARPGRLSV